MIPTDDRKYFSYSPDIGLNYHKTLAEARAAAQSEIDGYSDACDPEWPEDVEFVCCGIVLARATEKVIRDPGTNGPQDIGVSDYELVECEIDLPMTEDSCAMTDTPRKLPVIHEILDANPPVVRCRDCKHWFPPHPTATVRCCNHYAGLVEPLADGSSFCSFGDER